MSNHAVLFTRASQRGAGRRQADVQPADPRLRPRRSRRFRPPVGAARPGHRGRPARAAAGHRDRRRGRPRPPASRPRRTEELGRLADAFNAMTGATPDRGAEREALIERLEPSNRELEDFAFVASHDLQEPLRKIRTFGDLLEQKWGDRLDAGGRDYLATDAGGRRPHADPHPRAAPVLPHRDEARAAVAGRARPPDPGGALRSVGPARRERRNGRGRRAPHGRGRDPCRCASCSRTCSATA